MQQYGGHMSFVKVAIIMHYYIRGCYNVQFVWFMWTDWSFLHLKEQNWASFHIDISEGIDIGVLITFRWAGIYVLDTYPVTT